MTDQVIEGFSTTRYLALPSRARAKLLHRLGRRIFGRDPGFRVPLHREPPRDAQWIPQLSTLLDIEPSPHLQKTITMYIARIQSETAIPVLISALRSPARGVRWWAAWGLGAVRAGNAVAELAPLLTQSDRLREVAGDAIVRIGDSAGLLVLNDAIERLEGSARSGLETRADQLRHALSKQTPGDSRRTF